MTGLPTTLEAAAAREGSLRVPSAATAGRVRGEMHDPRAVPMTRMTGASLVSLQEPQSAACGGTDTCHQRPPWIDEEDVAFVFTAMTWNVDLLEVLLSKAENPLLSNGGHGGPHDCQQQQHQAACVAEEVDAKTLAGAAFPTLEEALLTAFGATRTTPRSRNRPSGGNHSRRSRRRKIGRGRTTQLRIYSAFLYEGPVEVDDGTEEEDEEVADGDKKPKKAGRGGEHSTTRVPYNVSAVGTTEETYGTYLTEEDESDTCYKPHRCLEAHDSPPPGAAIAEGTANTAARVTEPVLQTTVMGREDEKREETAQRLPSSSPPVTMRDFLRLFFQSFVIVVVAKLRHQEQHALSDGRPHPLSALEYRALCFVHRHLAAFKEILRRHVMGSKKEVERRAAQSLLVDAFQCDETRDGNKGTGWKPSYAQVYISGREPVYQPLLLESLHITRVVQCYANPPQSDASDPRGGAKNKDMALNALYCWRRLLLEGPDVSMNNNQNVEGADSLFVCEEEQNAAHEIFGKCLSPLVWEPYSAFGPYMIYTTKLPCSSRLVAKLVVPAEDRESYDLSKHFQEGVFSFLHGTPFFPFDAARCGSHNPPSPLPRCCSLVHCSAGMHRSSGLAIAYLLWLVAVSCGELPVVRDAAEALIERDEKGKGRRRQQQQQQPVVSYLSVFLGHREQRPNSNETIAADGTAAPTSPPLPAAAGDACMDAEGGCVEQNGKETDSMVEKTPSIFELCVGHVRRQRSMAVPIPAVQEHLRRYANYLQLQ